MRDDDQISTVMRWVEVVCETCRDGTPEMRMRCPVCRGKGVVKRLTISDERRDNLRRLTQMGQDMGQYGD